MTDSDDALLRAASQGDAPAIDELLERHLPHVRRYLLRHAGARVRGHESVSDLVQSVCREALEHAADGRVAYHGDGAFRRWLYQAAMLKVLNRDRYWKAGKRDGGELPLAGAGSEDPGVAVPGDLPSPSEGAMRGEALERFGAAFARLDTDAQTIIVLAHVEGLDHADIGARLGLTPAHSRTRLSRALARLATLATGPGGGHG